MDYSCSDGQSDTDQNGVLSGRVDEEVVLTRTETATARSESGLAEAGADDRVGGVSEGGLVRSNSNDSNATTDSEQKTPVAGAAGGDGDILKDFSPAEREVIMKVPAAANLDDLKLFVKLSQYFRGEHHLEEIMYHENMRRSTLLTLIDKFREILVKHEHEDKAITSYFFKSMK